ncbi:MAG: TonB-dependent receptor plug domain-containing protein [Bacteroidia bacterium]
MRHFLLTILGFVLPCLLIGQVKIEGVLVSAETKEPIESAKITTIDRFQGCYSDESGRFSLSVETVPDSIYITGFDGHTYAWAVPIFQKAGVISLDISLPSHNACLCIRPVIIASQPYESNMDQVQPAELARGDASSIEQGLNLIPGVKFESRGPGGSRRLAIRGSLIRSAFGVREIKVYQDGVPLTSPDGSTPLELLDAQGIQSLEVVKGPVSADYGAVSNGVLFTSTKLSEVVSSRHRFRLSQQLGSFGYVRTAVTKTFGRRSVTGSIHWVHQQLQGYRQQESNAKDHLQAHIQWEIRSHTLTFHAMGYTGNWGLPGSLSSQQTVENPRQALPYSLSANAHVERRHLRGTLSHIVRYRKYTGLTAAYLHGSDKVNPYGTSAFFQGYKLERSISTGFRHRSFLVVMRDFYLASVLEHQTEWVDYREFENVQGSPGSRRLISDNRASQSFGNLEAMLYKRAHRLRAAASLTRVTYSQDVHFSNSGLINAKTDFGLYPAFLLRYSYSRGGEKKPSFHLSAMNGFSPPAVWEIMDSTGGFRNDLKPERSFNLEARGSKTFEIRNVRIVTAVNAYNHWLRDAILPTVLSTGRTVYENRGRINTTGLEGQVEISKEIDASLIFKQLNFSVNGSLQRMVFQSYPLNGEDFKGNRVPGAPAVSFNVIFDCQFRPGTMV